MMRLADIELTEAQAQEFVSLLQERVEETRHRLAEAPLVDALLAACEEAHVVLSHYNLERRVNGVNWKPVDELQRETIDQLWAAIIRARPELAITST